MLKCLNFKSLVVSLLALISFAVLYCVFNKNQSEPNVTRNSTAQINSTPTVLETLNLSKDDLIFEKEVFEQGQVNKKCKRKIDQRIKDLKGVVLSKTPHKEGNIVVSLTSFPSRKNFVKYAIYSLMMQRLKANRIILWLSQDEFKNKEADLDPLLLKLKENGLEIRFVEGNIRSHKKYFLYS